MRNWRAGLLAAVLAIVGVMMLAPAQQPKGDESGATSTSEFEVATIKSHAAGDGMVWMGGPPGRYEAKNVTARMMVEEAYDVPADEVSGGAEWVSAQRFDIAAKIADGQWEEMKKLDSWRQGQMTRLLLQSLLRERFHLTIAHQAKELQVYALLQAKGGARLRVTGTPLAAGGTPEGMYVLGFSDKDAPVGALAEFLSGYFGRSVLDQTGLTGRYDIDFSVRVPEQNTPIDAQSAIFRDLEDQLGLKLESRKAVVDTIVIERMEQPSAN